MDLPLTRSGSKHVVVFQDFLTKWPLVFPVKDQKAITLAKLFVEEVIPTFGVPEALLSDRGTNLLSHLMLDLCKLMGIKKLNTTAYHPQCDGMVERFNRTLKTILRKHAAMFGDQWDTYLYGVLYAYRNTPHESTGEKPSFLLYGVDCRTPTEAALLLPSDATIRDLDLADYREQVVLTLQSARDLAVRAIKKAQDRYKRHYDTGARCTSFKIGDWVFVRFPQEETGRLRKLSRPWHGPYRITTLSGPDVCVTGVYHPDSKMKIHMSRVKLSPQGLPTGFYWYGGNRKSLGHVPTWVDGILQNDSTRDVVDTEANLTEHDSTGDMVDNLTEDDPTGDALDPSTVEDGQDDGARLVRSPEPVGRYPLRRQHQPPNRYGFARDEQL